MVDCGKGRPPTRSLLGCAKDLELVQCLGLELLALAGTTVTYWHVDHVETTIDPLYQEPVRASRRDSTRWDWDAARTFNAIIVEPESTDVSGEEEGLKVNTSDLALETSASIWGSSLPLPVEGDLMVVGGLAYDVVRVGSGLWYHGPAAVTTKIYLMSSAEYVPDRRL